MKLDVDMLKALLNNIDTLEKFIISLLFVLSLNIVMMLLKFYIDHRHSKYQFFMERKKLIFENALKIEHEIFTMIDDLALFDKSQITELVQGISETRDCLYSHRLYIERDLFDAFDKALDYYSLISSNFRNKDPKKEKKLTNNIIKAFHG